MIFQLNCAWRHLLEDILLVLLLLNRLQKVLSPSAPRFQPDFPYVTSVLRMIYAPPHSLRFLFPPNSTPAQAQPISPELTAKLLGNRVAVSPIVTVEPR